MTRLAACEASQEVPSLLRTRVLAVEMEGELGREFPTVALTQCIGFLSPNKNVEIIKENVHQYLWIVRRRNTKHIAGDLRSQIRNANELFENILRQNICVPSLLDIIRRHIDVIRS